MSTSRSPPVAGVTSTGAGTVAGPTGSEVEGPVDS